MLARGRLSKVDTSQLSSRVGSGGRAVKTEGKIERGSGPEEQVNREEEPDIIFNVLDCCCAIIIMVESESASDVKISCSV